MYGNTSLATVGGNLARIGDTTPKVPVVWNKPGTWGFLQWALAALGVVAVLVGSDLEIPAPLPKLFPYLLLAIGFRGGVELQQSGLGFQVVVTVLAAMVMSVLVPIYCFFVLRQGLDRFNAAAIAATYGSISAVTFITAESFLDVTGTPHDGFMVAALALMESPAIIVGLLLVKLSGGRPRSDPGRGGWGGKRA